MAEAEIKAESPKFETMQPAFYNILSKCETVLIAGCGGGFDIFQGIPLFSHLKAQGKKVHLANLTFCGVDQFKDELMVDPSNASLYKIVANTGLENSKYCPEAFLAQYMHEKLKIEQPVYLILREGYVNVMNAYKTLLKTIGKVDAIVLIDGGTDSLMRGNEYGIGTVEEDYTSMLVVNDLPDVEVKLLAALGMGVDRFHEVSDVASLRAISEIHQKGGFLGAQMLFSGTPAVDMYIDAVGFASERTSVPSIVGSSIRDAMLGHFGNHHSNRRTKHSKLFINPLMTLLSVFDLKVTVNRIEPAFREAYRKCETMISVRQGTGKAREQIEILEEEDYPATGDRF